MKTGKVILIIAFVIIIFTLTFIIIQLAKKPADTNTPPPVNPGSGSGNYGGGNNGGSGSGNNNPPPPAPSANNWTDLKIGDTVFAVLPVNAYDRDIFGTGGQYAHALNTFQPGAYIGTVRSIISNHGLMLSNTSISNPNLGDPFFISGVNGEYRKG